MPVHVSASNNLAVTAHCASESAEERRQMAMLVALQCEQILVQQLGADEVFVFGSLRGDSPWHEGSDLDLAVSGFDSDQVWDAITQLEEVVPDWLPFDLVSIDQVDARVRDRILQVEPMPENQYLSLKQRLEDELAATRKVIVTLKAVLEQADTASPLLLTPALASYVENFYSGCEKIAKRIAVALDGGLPKGEAWHQQLLLQMSEPSESGRPALWEKSLLQQDLDSYRRFRHRVRHLYNFDLDDERVLAMAQRVPAVFEKVETSVELFNKWLDEQE